jgi:2C-methyl-D-erythritol 2,4-cyclodiphosphate synthase
MVTRFSNIDFTYVGQVPKILSYSKQIRQNLSTFINIDFENISCKATTTDHLGFEGKLEGISCHCVVLIERQ